MKNIKEIREAIKESVVTRLSALPAVCSITFVGSFVHKEDITIISDIDIIVIVEHLHEQIFNDIRDLTQSITGADCQLPGYQVKLNMSFGPLKFNDDKTLVFHVMVYDKAGHRQHVIDSPFTCRDWEYEKAVYGADLSAIYPANALQLQDIIGSRRGLASYMDDIRNGVITYRNYVFTEDGIREEKNSYPMDDRHKKEYAYHVIKFLMLNLLKIVRQENKKYTDAELSETFLQLDPGFMESGHLFLALSLWKYSGGAEPDNIFERAADFIWQLEKWFAETDKRSTVFVCMRHAKTELNDGSFLGIGRDPEILPVDRTVTGATDRRFDVVYTGTLKRTISTGAMLAGDIHIENKLLNEIDYGSAEGLMIDDLNKRFPYMLAGWQKKEDPKFPGGENQADVEARLGRFIKEELIPATKKDIAIVSHNIVIRVLLGKLYQADIQDWFRFNPGHMEAIPFRILNGTLIPELNKEQRVKFRDQMMQWN